ncbi:trans-aconitate 2-methyltransferase [Varunaivibrio sulfuroxidans]|uniref:Trans-aconitate 2-methyltransferase n=2 Tax=Varunaivibrio sulfuroxidans TaxID=1773489 RepID=A0A4V2UP91_9PROT|nr:methyltransferase domain-containing protein [Varunaivibrio sulfuroxidans]TCS65001.1 trans-aconitate 2-methyltransferase [Varunaivibrio sulfuroxidans]
MSDWNPKAYLAYAEPRLRPAQDLLVRIPLNHPGKIVDLGCGPGTVTRLLAARWPDAEILGVDSAPEMLARAREENTLRREEIFRKITFTQGDIADWAPDGAPDLIFSNAALHWLDDHPLLFPRLFAMLAPGGVLAVQMPRNFSAPSHMEMTAAARGGPWAQTLEPLLRPVPVAPPEVYWDILSAVCARLDIWETTYLQVLDGDDAVFKWISSTALAPLRNALPEPWRAEFLDAVRTRLARAYPRRADGKTLFPFTRQFIIAHNAA